MKYSVFSGEHGTCLPRWVTPADIQREQEEVEQVQMSWLCVDSWCPILLLQLGEDILPIFTELIGLAQIAEDRTLLSPCGYLLSLRVP